MERFSTKQLTNSIFALANQCSKLLNQDKKYEPLLKKLLEYHYKEEYIPQIKDLCKEINYDYGKFKNHLQKIYDDLLAIIGDDNFIFDMRETIYSFTVYHPEKGLGFNARLDHELNIGDVIQCNFFQPYFYSNSFYIWHIYDKEIFENKIVINIQLVHYSHIEEVKLRNSHPVLIRAREEHRELIKFLKENT